MALQGGGNELAGDVAFIDGELYPLDYFEYNVEHDIDEVVLASGMKSQTVVSGTSIAGTIETYREIKLPAHLGLPERHRVYLFTEQNGTKERIILDGVFFEPEAPRNNRKAQTVDFVAEELIYD